MLNPEGGSPEGTRPNYWITTRNLSEEGPFKRINFFPEMVDAFGQTPPSRIIERNDGGSCGSDVRFLNFRNGENGQLTRQLTHGVFNCDN